MRKAPLSIKPDPERKLWLEADRDFPGRETLFVLVIGDKVRPATLVSLHTSLAEAEDRATQAATDGWGGEIFTYQRS
jgi:hypothetical protein